MADTIIQAKDIKLKLYLEGIKMPISRIEITEVAGTYPIAAIKLPMNDRIIEIEPRTTVHVFYSDSMTGNRWLLIFEGEVSGFNLEREASSRNVSLDCVHIANHWEFAKKDGQHFGGFLGEQTTKIHVTFPASGTKAGSLDIPQEQIRAWEIIDAIDKDALPKNIQEQIETLKVARSDPPPIDYLMNFSSGGAIIGVGFANAAKELIVRNANSFRYFLLAIISGVAKSNLGYAVPHIVYQISKRLIGFDNKKIESISKTVIAHAFLKERVGNLPGNTNLLEIVTASLNLYNFKIVYPAAPTYDNTLKAPQSFLITPTPTLFVPPACNTFFKDEVQRATFTRNMLREPTRVGISTYPQILPRDLSNITKISQKLLIAPTGKLILDPTNAANPVTIQLSREERIRGIYGQMFEDDFKTLKVAQDAISEDREFKEGEDADQKKARIKAIRDYEKEYLSKTVNSVYQTRVLTHRVFSLTTAYSPYRLCGFPGIYIDEEGSQNLPCVVGKISQITSSIDANGLTSSQILFKYPRTIRAEGTIGLDRLLPIYKNNQTLSELDRWLLLSGWEVDELDSSVETPKGLKPRKEVHWPFSPNSKSRDGAYSFGETYKKTSEDDMWWIDFIKFKLNFPETLSFLDSWYDTGTFFPDVIGQKVYKKIMYGIEENEDSTTFLDEDDQTYFSEHGTSLDGSIGKFRATTPEFKIGIYDDQENTEWFAHFINTIQTHYSTLESREKLRFAHRFSRRKLVTEGEFWKFLINLPENKTIDQIDKEKNTKGYPLGVRSISMALSDERTILSEILTENLKDNSSATSPFIKERRNIIKSIKRELITKNEYIVGV